MKLKTLHLKAFRGFSNDFELSIGGHNALIFGENGASKSSIAKALEILFDPSPDLDLLTYKNLFDTRTPCISADFIGSVTNTNPHTGKIFKKAKTETLIRTAGQPKPLHSWVLSSASRSAFLDHRKILLLSDSTRDLSESFFRAAVQHLFANLPAGVSGKTVGQLWTEVNKLAAAYRQAQLNKGKEADSGVVDSSARYTPIEDGLNTLNTVLNNYLTPINGKKPRLVAEAERLLCYFENISLNLSLSFDNLSFNRSKGTFDGGRLHPEVKYCGQELTQELLTEGGEKRFFAIHHHILNEARLTALGLALFFAAVRLQDEVPYICGGGDPENPVRLLVLDDVLIGLDYDHRIPVLQLLRKEFLKSNRYQIILLTHNREWFDYCRLKVGSRGWICLEINVNREAGPKHSDLPVKKEGSCDLLLRAKGFLADPAHKEIPAAANYARTSIEWALKELCAQLRRPVPFTLEPHRLNTEVFLKALTSRAGGGKGAKKAICKKMQTDLEALRKTVLNAYSHWHPTTAVESDVLRAIDVAGELVKLIKKKK
jgi:hypothetical protein